MVIEEFWAYVQFCSVFVIMLNVTDRKGSIYKRRWYHNKALVGAAMILVLINSMVYIRQELLGGF